MVYAQRRSFKRSSTIAVGTRCRRFWPLAHLGLARSFALQGDVLKSRQAYEEFFRLWNGADNDARLLLEAKRGVQHVEDSDCDQQQNKSLSSAKTFCLGSVLTAAKRAATQSRGGRALAAHHWEREHRFSTPIYRGCVGFSSGLPV